MISPALANAIVAFRAAEAAIPESCPDEVMNAAVALEADWLECVIAIPSRSGTDVVAKLTLAHSISEECCARARLIAVAVEEQIQIEADRVESEANELAWVIAEERRNAA